ncbi:unnamed protein product [Rotaria magnacalcarata]|uniref:Uncharacterized protein n=1 Tax=Rotaria magnacalcarata TaxID=392030 RepID=A0A820E1Q3_9BILA|nr:unnamed protein product [Rotaria magnacalcarata]CAF4099075.1 unnamed protein product [Rotaria magnacalcarata]CAF4175562.1 unnamed protein product [Rotaria magnacalcarata]CAF4241383.1 unnamed protein product [Rotaria magnacalcarata]CAF5108756.1 unnamed protein product [Rotaria magnacalcarata]
MAENRSVFLVHIAILILIIVSTCSAYALLKDSVDVERPVKYHPLSDPSRYTDRTKQYHNTMEKLKFWRRYPNEFDEENSSAGQLSSES